MIFAFFNKDARVLFEQLSLSLNLFRRGRGGELEMEKM